MKTDFFHTIHKLCSTHPLPSFYYHNPPPPFYFSFPPNNRSIDSFLLFFLLLLFVNAMVALLIVDSNTNENENIIHTINSVCSSYPIPSSHKGLAGLIN